MKLTYDIAVLCTLLLAGSLPPAKGATMEIPAYQPTNQPTNQIIIPKLRILHPPNYNNVYYDQLY